MDTETLRRLFTYEPSGTLRRVVGARKPYPWRDICGGRYKVCTVGGKTRYLHRLIWQYHHGREPSMVDHINGDTTDNRIENLRECTAAQNQYNSRRKRNNRSGRKGVVYHKKCTGKPWHAKIRVKGKVISLGYHPTVEEAGAAYDAAAKRYAGEFARS